MPLPTKAKKTSVSAKSTADEKTPEGKDEKDNIPSPKAQKKEKSVDSSAAPASPPAVKHKGDKTVWNDDMKGQPVKDYKFEEFCSVLQSIFTDEVFDEKYKEDYERYVKLDLDWSLALRKIKNYIKEGKKVSATKHGICIGIEDMAALEYDDAGNVAGKKEPWSVWLPTFFDKEGVWGRLNLKKKTNFDRIGFKLMTAGDIQIQEEDTKTGYHNNWIKKMENYEKFDITPILKQWWMPPEYVVDTAFAKDEKDAKVKRSKPILVLYGKIGTFFLLQVKDKDGNDTDEFPYAETLDKSGHKNPCFKFTLSNPDSFEPTDKGNFIIFQADQHYSQYTFNVDGWTEKYAENLNKLADPEDILSEMKETFGSTNDIYVFVVCTPAYISEKKGHRNYNAVYVEETDFRVGKDGISPFAEFMKRFDGKQLYGKTPVKVTDAAKPEEEKTEKATDALAQRREAKDRIANGFKRLGNDASVESLIAGGFIKSEQVANAEDRKQIETMVASVRKKAIEESAPPKSEEKKPEETPKPTTETKPSIVETKPSAVETKPSAESKSTPMIEMTETDIEEIDGFVSDIEKALISGEMEMNEVEPELRSSAKKFGPEKVEWFVQNKLAACVKQIKDGLSDDKEGNSNPDSSVKSDTAVNSKVDASSKKIDESNPNRTILVGIIKFIGTNDSGDGVAISDISKENNLDLAITKGYMKELEDKEIIVKKTPRRVSLK